MDEYAKAKLKVLEDNAKFIEAIKLLGLEATYFAGRFTVRNKGAFIGCMSASQWLIELAAAMDQVKQERSQ